MSYEAQRGMYLHPTYAVTPDREPLGMLDAWMWAREKRGKDGVWSWRWPCSWWWHGAWAT